MAIAFRPGVAARYVGGLLLGWAILSPVLGATTSYHVGNSLTFDSQPLGVAKLARQQGFTHTAGQHIRCASSLPGILDNPDDVCAVVVPEFGLFSEALPNHAWDYVTLQVHPQGESTMGDDLASAVELINLTRSNPANADTVFFVYAAWPRRFEYQKSWTAPAADDLQAPTSHSRAYYDHFITRLRQQTDAEIHMTPVGEVLYDLSVKIDRQEIPGIASFENLYRDNTHLDLAVGRYIAGATTFTTLFQSDPASLTRPNGFYGEADDFSPELYAAIHESIRRVVVTHPYANVDLPIPTSADFNTNGVVDQLDLAQWLGSFGVELPADADNDAEIDGRDFLAWQRAQFYPAGADFNGDLAFSEADLAVWESAFAASDAGDADDDGHSGGDDLLAWQRSLPPPNGPDANGNGVVEENDYAIWRRDYGQEGRGDFDDDQLAAGDDFLLWQRLFTANHPTDFNLDRAINRSDLAIWEQSAGRHQRGDATDDRAVGGEDFLTWQRDFGLRALTTPNVAVTVVPEPAACGLALYGLALCGSYSRYWLSRYWLSRYWLSRKRRA